MISRLTPLKQVLAATPILSSATIGNIATSARYTEPGAVSRVST